MDFKEICYDHILWLKKLGSRSLHIPYIISSLLANYDQDLEKGSKYTSIWSLLGVETWFKVTTCPLPKGTFGGKYEPNWTKGRDNTQHAPDKWCMITTGCQQRALKFFSTKSILQSIYWKHIQRVFIMTAITHPDYIHHPHGWHFIIDIPSPDSTKTAKLVHKNNYPVHLIHCLLQHHQ